jgi:hypothetical protein
MRLTPFDRHMMIGALTALRELQATPMPTGYGDGSLKAAIEDASNGIVRLDASRWMKFHADSPSFRMACSRCYAKLDRYGLWNRVVGWSGSQTTHLELLPVGIELAEKWMAEEPSNG